MSKERKTKSSHQVSPTESKLKLALSQSVILPRDVLAKGQKLQTAISQSTILPKERRVLRESMEKPSTKKRRNTLSGGDNNRKR